MLVFGEYNALSEPVLHHRHRPVNQSDECDLDATLRGSGCFPLQGTRAMRKTLRIGRMLAEAGQPIDIHWCP